MSLKTLDDIDVANKRVLLRADLDVPMREGMVIDDSRIRRTAHTVMALTERGARVVVASHLGHPHGRDPSLSLRPVAEALSHVLYNTPVQFVEDCVGPAARRAVDNLAPGDVIMLENLRFHPGEEKNDQEFAKALAELADAYVDDAFADAHRVHASIVGLPELLPAAAGRLMHDEIDALARLLREPERPFAAVIGGADVGSKIGIVGSLLDRLDVLLLGGTIANTFLAAQGVAIGASLHEPGCVADARRILAHAAEARTEILLPTDVVVARGTEAASERRTVRIDKVPAGDRILDIGTETAERYIRKLAGCRTAIWSGPLGAAEVPGFDGGTIRIAFALSELTKARRLVSVVGGGDTLADIADTGTAEDFTHACTAGGAFLEWLKGKELPGVAALSD